MNRVSRNDVLTGVLSEKSGEKRKEELKEGKEIGYDVDREEQRIHNDGLRDFYAHRKLWSHRILRWISLLILFNIILTFFVGWRVYGFNFDNMQWFVTPVAAETFIQIVGLGYVAARYLFSREQQQDRMLRAKFLD